jgi:outer membrane receptor protein involved in Fe transport
MEVITISHRDEHKADGESDMIVSNKKMGLFASIAALLSTGGGAGDALAQDDSGDRSARLSIEEIVVTASKRAESIQHVASSVTALGNEEIERRGLVSMDDFLRSIPGVNHIDRGVASNSTVIRGVSSDGQLYTDMGGTVGFYLGDVPLSGNAVWGSNADIKLVDIERVEVLRGPQGTLYGEGSLGGSVRIIPAPPDLNRQAGSARVGYSHTGNEGGANKEIQGVVNLPLIQDKLAVRAVGYVYDNSGYVNNVAASSAAFAAQAAALGFSDLVTDQRDVGNSEYRGGRIMAMWQPIEKLSATLMYLRQDLEQKGLPEVQLPLGGFAQTRYLIRDEFGGGGERLRDDIEISNLDLHYELGWGRLSSSTSYIHETGLLLRDASAFFGGFAAPQRVDSNVKGFVEELRLTSQLDGPFQFLVGLYYNDTDRRRFSSLYVLQTPLLTLGASDRLATATQKALFGELSYDITDRFTATVGGRAFEYDQKFETLSFITATPTTTTLASEGRTGNTSKINLTYDINDDALLYVQWAEGFRLGAPLEPPPAAVCDVDNDGLIDGTNLSALGRQLDPDSLESYELGTKLRLFDGRIALNTSFYRNNWSGIPVIVQVPCTFGQFLNAGEARTQGLEFETAFSLTRGLQLVLGASYLDAYLTKDAPGIGRDGDRLPASPRYNVNASVQYDFELGNAASFVRTDYLRVGGFSNNLAGTGPEIGDYTHINLRAGATFGRMHTEVFVNNVTNADDLTWIDSIFAGVDARANRLHPRTIGLNLGYSF